MSTTDLPLYRQMQVVDDRESRIRTSFQRLEKQEGVLSREAIIELVTVGELHRFTNPY